VRRVIDSFYLKNHRLGGNQKGFPFKTLLLIIPRVVSKYVWLEEKLKEVQDMITRN